MGTAVALAKAEMPFKLHIIFKSVFIYETLDCIKGTAVSSGKTA